MTTTWAQEIVKAVPLLLLGAVGVYFAIAPKRSTKKKASAATTNDVAQLPPQQEGPLIYKDDDTGEYLIFENGSETPRPITADEIYELTGSRPIEEELRQDDVVEEPQVPLAQEPANGGGVIGPEDFEGVADEQIDVDLEQANQRLPAADVAGPGPRTTANNRMVGTKKAKSIERKDQRRAFFEHQRMQAMVDKQDAEEFDRQYGDLIKAEREERRALEEQADLERKQQLQAQKLQDEALRSEKVKVRRELQQGLEKPDGVIMQLKTDLEKELVQPLVSSVSGGSGSAPFVVGDVGNWVVRFSESELEELGKWIKEKGSVSYEEIADKMTSIKRR